ncbi:MAG: sterol desaturase family protein [Candidatus Methylomirabilis sp.]|nr:sterol desaturase family protein [Deltaproteobacteria bacterium]
MIRRWIPKFDPAALPRTLGATILYFFRRSKPQVLGSAAILALTMRVAWGAWSVWDAVIVLALLAWWPIQEWLIHVYILHWKPRTVLGRKIDFYVSSKHRRHHRNPLDLKNIFIPWPNLVGGIVFHLVFWPLVLPAPLALTTIAAYLLLTVHYEWVHFICHTPYVPAGGRYKRLWLHHRLHHFRNEHYWMGVSMTAGDALLGTAPEKDAVPLSPTCRTLGVEDGYGAGAPAAA